ncbi:chondroitinase-B domain-containing protein [Rubrivirga marina]|uniref:Alginate lyase n=1 Tax=Rubrivirga marina TaxID=1196024 RepID=A0A271IYK4_9BACT|nr:chondroitinase-B domain-containing protein [Rubrivirga marina]PAP75884.1 alginate lyase [Rubrivirga marina]
MTRSLPLLAALATLAALLPAAGAQTTVRVATAAELDAAIAGAGPGTEIVMADGEWSDVRIRLVGTGTAEAPITLRAETPGGVVVRGASDLWLAGEHLVVDGLHFRDGAAPGDAVIQFAVSDDSLANHSRVTNCVIEGYNQPQRDQTDLWVRFRGRHNQLDRCYLAGKSNRGPTIRVDLEGTPSAFNYHRITNNHFGPRPPKGGPSAETLQIGDSSTSMSPSHTLVEDNLFDRCDGEVEVISSKSNFNEFRGNVFYHSEGSLVTRHGAYVTVDGNVFIGDGANPYFGGVRLIGTGHRVTNNYFFGLRGEEFRAPLALMNGIYRSSINRYFQVTDVTVAHNTWVDTESPWQIGVGSNVDQAEVLPPSEIRDQPPVRTLFANNVLYNSEGDGTPILRVDSIDGIEFRSNVIDNQGVPFEGVEGLVERDLTMTEVVDDVWVAMDGVAAVPVHHGFEFDQIDRDLFGQPRGEQNAVGATNGTAPEAVDLFDPSRYGPAWFRPGAEADGPGQTHAVRTPDELARAVAEAGEGDVIELAGGAYEIVTPLAIDQEVTVRAADPGDRPVIRYAGGAGTPAFEMNPGGHLRLANVVLHGGAETLAFAPLRSGMSSLYTLEVEDAEISGFDAVLRAYKHSFADLVRLERVRVRDVANGLELAAEDDDRGDYNAERVVVLDSRFETVGSNVIDYYRGGYDESTVGGTLVVRGTTVTGSGADDADDVLLGTYGIINVDLSGNTFRDNEVERVAVLWGAKNNTHADNTVERSGEIVVEQNLPQRLVY